MEFVSFEIAKKLKEKGFPQVKIGTLAMYNEEGEWYSLSRNLDEFEYLFEDFDYHDCVCPTISQVLKWLREEKKISIEISLHCSLKWMCSIYGFSDGIADFTQYNNDVIDDTIYILYDSYEQAVLAGIECVLDNLI